MPLEPWEITVKTRILISFVIVTVVSACASAPQVTVTPQDTVTLAPTQTPGPTLIPQPQLPAEVVEKFKEAGIEVGEDGKIGENAVLDGDGLHVTTEEDGEKKTTDISLEALNNAQIGENGGMIIEDSMGNLWYCDGDRLVDYETYSLFKAIPPPIRR